MFNKDIIHQVDFEERFDELLEKFEFSADYPLFACDEGGSWIPNALENMIKTIMTLEDKISILTDERFDILTEYGGYTNITEARTIVHRDGLWHKTVHIWILNSKNELLLSQRSENKDSWAGYWDISCAGHIIAGKTGAETVVSEMKEELGLNVEFDKIGRIKTALKKSSVSNNGTFIDNEFMDILLYRKDIELDSLVLQEEEVQDVMYIHVDELKQRIKDKSLKFSCYKEEMDLLFRYIDGLK